MTSPQDTSRKKLLSRWILLGGLFVGELALCLTRFSTSSLGDAGGDGGSSLLTLLSSAWLLPKIGLAIGAATLLFGAQRLREELRHACDLVPPQRGLLVPLLVHLTFFAGVFALTRVVFEGLEASASPDLWIAAWAATGLACAAAGLNAMLPAKAWTALARRNAKLIGGALAIGLVAWFAGRLSTAELWEPLRASTLFVSHAMLSWMTDDVVLNEATFVFGTSTFACKIAPECSGFEGIGLVWVFISAYLWLFRAHLKFPNAWLLLAVGTIVIWFANAARITALVAIGTWISPRIAVEGFHSVAGMACFCIVSLALILVSRRMSFFSRTTQVAEVNRTAVYVAPLLAMVVVAMVAGPFSFGLDTLYPLRPLAVMAVVVFFRPQLAKISWHPTLNGVSIGVLAFVIWMVALYASSGAPTVVDVQLEWQNLPALWAVFWIVFRIAGTIWMAPLTEELAFRGYLNRRLVDVDFDRVPLDRVSVPAILISSILFGLTHHHYIAATICGVLYSVAQIRARSVSDAIVAHATTNGLLVVYALVSGEWSVWLVG